MPEITAAAVKALRDQTGLPMMDCKRALQEAGGDAKGAVELLRKAGMKVLEKGVDRQTSEGRIAIHAGLDADAGSIIELQCESAPVATNEDFVQLANDLARQLVTGPGAATPEELLQQTSPSKTPETLKAQFDELVNRIREVFRLKRIARVEGPCGGYVHHDGKTGVLLEVEGGDATLAKDISMHIAAMRPSVVSREELDSDAVAKEREILSEQARKEGKSEGIIDKMVEGRMRDFYEQHCLLDQPYVKGEGKKDTVGKVAKAAGMKIVRFIHWELGKE
ncbi:MAG: translation elongation factor Ts [Planctomycetota bacterium]